MHSAIDVVETLCRRYAFGDVRALLPMLDLPDDDLRRLRRLCLFGQRLLDLDAEDFDMSDVDGGGPEYHALVARARACRMPQHPKEEPRGALQSLRPAYRLLLEVVRARYLRHDMAGLVATVHIISEYLPLLPWENVWGHAADPASLAEIDGDARFGTDTDPCAHNRTDRGATARALRVVRAPAEGWQAYLDRFHSNVAHAVGVCAAECRHPCGIVTTLDAGDAERLAERCQIALAFGDSALIRLRHSAPVGHGFGVPSGPEVDEAWQHTREVLSRRGGSAAAVLNEDGFCLAGLPSLLSALAGARLEPDTLLHDTAALTVTKLRPACEVAS